MYIVVSYDVVDDKRRRKLAEILKDYGYRVQYSVFECDFEKKYLKKMLEDVSKQLNQKEDSLRIYALCSDCQQKVISLGRSQPSHREPDIVI